MTNMTKTRFNFNYDYSKSEIKNEEDMLIYILSRKKIYELLKGCGALTPTQAYSNVIYPEPEINFLEVRATCSKN